MADPDLQNSSVVLYQYMCQHIAGSEKTVKTKRLFTAINDYLCSDKHWAIITSGSFGEGLEMKGSDYDVMYVQKDLQVFENIERLEFNVLGTYFNVITDDTKVGFVKLLLVYSHDDSYTNLCIKYKGNVYLSNQLIKSYLKSSFIQYPVTEYTTEINHGPCLSDKGGLLDNAICIHMKSWISEAKYWMTRPNSSWPSDDVKLDIVRHGVLFVPIGVKGSRNEEIEWRISFSVGEKLLINSFTHTQLLCYALMKVCLKDIINQDEKCKDLLCSYFIKNIIFWVSEEFSISIWKPCNMLSCFMHCFKRLVYCVEYSLCPHYFIPENNMFENRIEGQCRIWLRDKLYTLYQKDWQFILFSPQLNDFHRIHRIKTSESQLFISHFEQMNLSSALCFAFSQTPDFYHKFIKLYQSISSSRNASYYQHYISYLAQEKAETVDLNGRNNNRHVYQKYNLCQSYVLQGIHHDAVSGWFLLASLFYKIKKYTNALHISYYALSKCSQEKILWNTKISVAQREILQSEIIQRTGLINAFKYLRVDGTKFGFNSALMPRELDLGISGSDPLLPPVVYLHLLSFLCHFHLQDARKMRNSLEDLQLTISEEYFIENSNYKSVSYNCLGIALQLVGDIEPARKAFQNAIALDHVGLYSLARKRLSMLEAE